MNKLNNISQFIAPWADHTISVSSTVGLQAHFFGRKLSSPSWSHLSYVERSASHLGELEASALVNSRYSMSWDKISEKSGYLLNLIEHILECGPNNYKQIYSNWPSRIDVQDFYVGSNFRRAAQLFGDVVGADFAVSNARVVGYCAGIDAADVVSFDVFDTLLTRGVHSPADVFLLTNYQAVFESFGVSDVRLSPDVYSAMRSSAERALRIARDVDLSHGLNVREEITSQEIFDALVLRLDFIPKHIDRTDVSTALMQAEFDAEKAVLYATSIGRYLFDYAKKRGKRIIIVSDFCAPSDFVNDRLRDSGYTGYELYVSSDVQKKKHSGELFKLLSKEHGIDPNRVIHFGDNPHGDIEMAKASGWKAAQISLPKAIYQRTIQARGIDVTSLYKSIGMRTAAAIYANRYVSDDLQPKMVIGKSNLISSQEELGYLALGPVAYGFAKWAIDTSITEGFEQLVFFARDCYLPYNIATRLADGKYSGAIKTFYVAASRSGTKGLDFLRPEAVFEVDISDFSKQATISEVLTRRFRIDIRDVSPDDWRDVGIEHGGLKLSQVSMSSIYSLAFKVISRDWESRLADVKDKREIYSSYLKGLGLDLSKRTALVDIGYKGTITKVIGTLFDKPVLPIFFATYPDSRGSAPIHGAKCYLRDRMGASQFEIFRKYNLIFESLLNEPVGSLAGLVRASSKKSVKIVREAPPSDPHVNAIRCIHRGALRFAEDWLNRFENHIVEPEIEPGMAIEFISHILSNPTYDEALALKGVEFDNNFAGHAARYILTDDVKKGESLWIEGHAVLNNPERHYEVRREMILDGAYVDFKYEAQIICRDSFDGALLFGTLGRGRTQVENNDLRYNWVHNEVMAFRIRTPLRRCAHVIVTFINDAHFKIEDFTVWQSGIQIDFELVRLNNREFGLSFKAHPHLSIVIRQPGFRYARGESSDKKRFYWRFLSAYVWES